MAYSLTILKTQKKVEVVLSGVLRRNPAALVVRRGVVLHGASRDVEHDPAAFLVRLCPRLLVTA